MVVEDGVRREVLALAVNAEHLQQVTEVFSAYNNVVTRCFIVIKHCNISLSKFVTLVPPQSQSLLKVPDAVLLFLTCVNFPPLKSSLLLLMYKIIKRQIM